MVELGLQLIDASNAQFHYDLGVVFFVYALMTSIVLNIGEINEIKWQGPIRTCSGYSILCIH